MNQKAEVAVSKIVPLYYSLGNRARQHLKKKKRHLIYQEHRTLANQKVKKPTEKWAKTVKNCCKPYLYSMKWKLK